MLPPVIACTAILLSQVPEIEPPHAQNSLYSLLRQPGVTIEEHLLKFPAPRLYDGEAAGAEQAALRELAGSDRAVAELTRNSVSAPFILKVRDERTGAGTLIRLADLWFVVRADLDEIDLNRLMRQGTEGKPVEAGNMRFESHVLTEEELAAQGIKPPPDDRSRHEWYIHLTGRLLDRIHVETTDHIMATRSAHSWVVASRADPAFDDAKTFRNQWWPIVRKNGQEEPGPARRYAGGAGYVKISRLATVPGALLLEAHNAFAEPRAWFDGAPILRSKIGLIAQDRVRQLRRDLAQARHRARVSDKNSP